MARIIEAGALRTGYGRVEIVDTHNLTRISKRNSAFERAPLTG